MIREGLRVKLSSGVLGWFFGLAVLLGLNFFWLAENKPLILRKKLSFAEALGKLRRKGKLVSLLLFVICYL